MKESKQKVVVGETWIKVKFITGLTSAGSVSDCPGSSCALEVFLEEFEMLFFLCSNKKCIYVFLNTVLFCLKVLFSE